MYVVVLEIIKIQNIMLLSYFSSLYVWLNVLFFKSRSSQFGVLACMNFDTCMDK